MSAILLAHKGLKVIMVEEKEGLAVQRKQNTLSQSTFLDTNTGVYLPGVMPPELIKTPGVELPLMRRNPH